eukprot:355982-Chlamydomonas_euryale.AAC.7
MHVHVHDRGQGPDWLRGYLALLWLACTCPVLCRRSTPPLAATYRVAHGGKNLRRDVPAAVRCGRGPLAAAPGPVALRAASRWAGVGQRGAGAGANARTRRSCSCAAVGLQRGAAQMSLAQAGVLQSTGVTRSHFCTR